MNITTYPIILVVLFLIMFATFFYILVNARSLAKAAKQDAGADEINVGPGRKGASKSAMWIAGLLHFAAWAGIFFVWMGMNARTEATQPYGSEVAKEVVGGNPANQVATPPAPGAAAPITATPPAQAGTEGAPNPTPGATPGAAPEAKK